MATILVAMAVVTPGFVPISGGQAPYSYAWVDQNNDTIFRQADIYDIGVGMYSNGEGRHGYDAAISFQITQPDSLAIFIDDISHKSCTTTMMVIVVHSTDVCLIIGRAGLPCLSILKISYLIATHGEPVIHFTRRVTVFIIYQKTAT